MVNTMRLTNAIKEMMNGVHIALAIGELDAVIGQHRVDLVGYRGDQVPEELRGDSCVGLGMPLGLGKLTGAVNRDTPGTLAFFRAHVSHSEVEVTDRIAFERVLLGLIARDGWQATDAVPLQTTAER